MNQYRIKYKQGLRGVSMIQADSVNGFKPTSDTYIFKMGAK